MNAFCFPQSEKNNRGSSEMSSVSLQRILSLSYSICIFVNIWVWFSLQFQCLNFDFLIILSITLCLSSSFHSVFFFFLSWFPNDSFFVLYWVFDLHFLSLTYGWVHILLPCILCRVIYSFVYEWSFTSLFPSPVCWIVLSFCVVHSWFLFPFSCFFVFLCFLLLTRTFVPHFELTSSCHSAVYNWRICPPCV